MWNAADEVLHRLPHQIPSLNQSLLSGLEPVGADPAPVKDGPSNPMSPVAATAGAAAIRTEVATTSDAIRSAPARRTDLPTGRARLARRRAGCDTIKTLLPRAIHHGSDRLQDDPEIEPCRPLRNVFDVEPKPLVERRFVPAPHLPQPGDPG